MFLFLILALGSLFKKGKKKLISFS
ncbi:hypothetical protein KBI33_03425 [Candidatus Shapirobacteria bacterium]|nr:hypothetical protein [Candidatus Shapirobacteria bacterium]